ncbi:MAG: DNA mismatch repair endonuclease MutL [Bacteroidales bacterium]|nr:DNA mismatch repair endonuclease MutL [Bacteroidales bacterium]
MSNIIKQLPDSVANQIAAGEVIQRPASAVKELLENAVDAGAGDIKLVVKDAGKTLIQVIDNGSGMTPMDARMCFERHATSKISKAEDLFAIRTMGFRGEAMASIAAIAQVEMKTRPHGDELGSCLKVEGSGLTEQETCQCAAGTNIAVRNLFFNVPARRNFLKSNNTETRHIIEEFIRVSAINPQIAFSMLHNDKVVFKLQAGSLKSRIVGIFGKPYNERLLPVQQKTDVLTISGFIGKPEFAKKTRGEQYFFVNKRYIRHAYLNHAVSNAFTELIPSDAHPSYFLNIEINPEDIDINIHPTKTEVNFKEAGYVYAILHAAVKQSIGKYSLTPTIDFNLNPEVETAFSQLPRKDLKQPGININPDYNPFKQSSSAGFEKPHHRPQGQQGWQKLYTETLPGQKTETSGREENEEAEQGLLETGHASPFFQLQQRYILTNVKSGMMLIDQQKAHERILYESFLEQLSGNIAASQQQLFPQTIPFSPDDAGILRSLKNEIGKLGFVMETFGASSFVVKGVPSGLKETDVAAILEKIVQNFKEQSTDLQSDKNINLARSMAANLSIKAGTRLEEREMADIFQRLFLCKVPQVSPDGKNILAIVPLTEIEKFLK